MESNEPTASRMERSASSDEPESKSWPFGRRATPKSYEDELLGRVDSLAELVLDLQARLEALEKRMPAGEKNRSSAVIREMNEADARNVLLSPLGHKQAEREFGLTYAQVYSCRFGYTFKKVHRELEKGGWVRPAAWERRVKRGA